MKLNRLVKRTKSATVVGHIDQFAQGQLFGWALDKENPETPLKLVISVGGQPLAEVVADTYREDLERNQVGTGRHAFQVHLPLRLAPGESAEISLARADSGQTVATNAFRLTREQSLRVEIEGIEGDRLFGSVHDAEALDLKGRLCLLVDGELASTGHGTEQDGKTHHFNIPLPREVFDSTPHTFAGLCCANQARPA